MSLPTGQPHDGTGVTLGNWRAHPWQMWMLTAIVAWALAVLSDSGAYLHTVPESNINNPAMLNLAAGGMLVGAAISLLGLHMRDREFGVWAEASGYLVIVGAQSIYLFLVFYYLGFHQGLVRTGTATILAANITMIYRTSQIISYQRSRHKVRKLEEEIVEQIESGG